MSRHIKLYPPAKINLGLYVFGIRPDGFHDVELLLLPIGPFCSNIKCDELSIREIPFVPQTRGDKSYSFGGRVRMLYRGTSCQWDPSEDLCVKAYRILAQDFSLPPVEILLTKNIPVGAGLGGGSSDGACTLCALNEMFGLSLSDEKLAEYAMHLGSDCPFFVRNSCSERRAMLGRGRGEILEPIDKIDKGSIEDFYKKYKIEVTYPGVHISTAHAYSVVQERKGDNSLPGQNGELICNSDNRDTIKGAGSGYIPIKEIVAESIEEWQGALNNDFEAPIFAEHPELKEIKEDFLRRGALYSAMTGTGSAVFGIFVR